MGRRLDSFDKEQMHPLVDAMAEILSGPRARAQRPAFANYFIQSAQQRYGADAAIL